MLRPRFISFESWKHAAGEIVLIVVGVTIALATSSWYDSRQRLRDETALLGELRTTLGQDLAGVTTALDTMYQADQDIQLLVGLFESGTFDSDNPDHRALVGQLERFTQVTIRTGPFETLKARGLNLISSPALRVTLTSLYDDEFPILQSDADIDRQLTRERILPYLLEHFDLTDDGWAVKPGHLASAGSLGATLGRYRSRTLVRFYLPAFARTTKLMTQALSEIDSQLVNFRD